MLSLRGSKSVRRPSTLRAISYSRTGPSGAARECRTMYSRIARSWVALENTELRAARSTSCHLGSGSIVSPRRDLRSRGLPRRSLSIGITGETRNPPPASPSGKPRRVSITDSFGASPVSSALDHSARRDPGRASTTVTRNLSPRKSHASSMTHRAACKCTLSQGKTVTSQANLYV
jgi:hypothetical protein